VKGNEFCVFWIMQSRILPGGTDKKNSISEVNRSWGR